MALVQRPAKQGGVTTYQAKVAQGYTKILSAEVDADLDTIYAAWNGGADTVNLADNSVSSAKLQASAVTPRELADGAVTDAKLAVSAHLWTAPGSTLNPVNPALPVALAVTTGDDLQWGTRTAKARLSADPSVSSVSWFYNRNLEGTLDDNTIPSWRAAFVSYTWILARAAAGATTLTTLVTFVNAGNLTLGPSTAATTVCGLVPQGGISAQTGLLDLAANISAQYPGYDQATPGWLLRLNKTADSVNVIRRPAASTTAGNVNLLTLDNAGNLTLGASGSAATQCTLIPQGGTSAQTNAMDVATNLQGYPGYDQSTNGWLVRMNRATDTYGVWRRTPA